MFPVYGLWAIYHLEIPCLSMFTYHLAIPCLSMFVFLVVFQNRKFRPWREAQNVATPPSFFSHFLHTHHPPPFLSILVQEFPPFPYSSVGPAHSCPPLFRSAFPPRLTSLYPRPSPHLLLSSFPSLSPDSLVIPPLSLSLLSISRRGSLPKRDWHCLSGFWPIPFC